MYLQGSVTIDNVHPDLLVAVQGLTSVKFKVADYTASIWISRDAYDVAVARSKICRETLEPVIREAMVVEKAKVYRPSKGFPQLMEWAMLDIDGEGRLGEDRKPGVVASRTRQSTRNLSKMDAFGVIPKEVSPKYNIDGDLCWGKLNHHTKKLVLH